MKHLEVPRPQDIENQSQTIPAPDDVSACEEVSDVDLVRAALSELPGVTVSYQALIRRHYPFAYQVAMRILESPEDAEEVAQDAMLQVFHKLSSFGGRSSFRSWLYAIVRNAARNRVSKNQCRKKAELAHLEINSQALVEPNAASGQMDRIQATLRKLDPDQREIILLRYLSGLSLEEIAETLEIGLSAAKMRLYRSMDAFKTAWDATDRLIIPYRPDPPK
ncbi:MAG: RNA polymerase sigma factor [Luteolibacter sp.]